MYEVLLWTIVEVIADGTSALAVPYFALSVADVRLLGVDIHSCGH